jgi:hypothetical protein
LGDDGLVGHGMLHHWLGGQPPGSLESLDSL